MVGFTFRNDNAKALSNDEASRNEVFNLLRRGRSRDVEVFGRVSCEQVSDASTDKVAFKAPLLKGLDNFVGVRIDVR